MSKNANNTIKKKTPLNFNSLVFWIAMVIFTIVFLLIILNLTTNIFKVKSVDNMTSVTVSDYKNKKDSSHDSYYVYLYDETSPKFELLNSVILEYANYVKMHSDANPIYVMDYTSKSNSSIISELNLTSSLETSLPGMILIKSGSVSTKYYSVSKVANELTAKMGK